MKKAVLFADGASFGNPGAAGIGAVVKAGGRTLEISEPIGVTTNNVAEYSALIRGLEEARALGADEITVCLDSELVVRQLSGRYRVKSQSLMPYFNKARALLGTFRKTTVKHVPREQNSHADRLSKKGAMAAKSAPPKSGKSGDGGENGGGKFEAGQRNLF